MWLFWAVAGLVLFFAFVIGLYVLAIWIFLEGVIWTVKGIVWAVRAYRRYNDEHRLKPPRG